MDFSAPKSMCWNHISRFPTSTVEARHIASDWGPASRVGGTEKVEESRNWSTNNMTWRRSFLFGFKDLKKSLGYLRYLTLLYRNFVDDFIKKGYDPGMT